VARAGGAKFWLRVRNDIRYRSVEDVLLVGSMASKSSPKRLQPCSPMRSFRRASFIFCATRWAPYPERTASISPARLIRVYRATDADAAEKALTAFQAGPWGQRYPAIGQSWRRAWVEVIPFFAFVDEVRRVVDHQCHQDPELQAQACRPREGPLPERRCRLQDALSDLGRGRRSTTFSSGTGSRAKKDRPRERAAPP
jgi:hypothetical protein